MESLKTIFKFIDTVDITVDQFEKECGLELGTLKAAHENQTPLSKDITMKIAKRYGNEMNDLGFYVIEGKAFGKKTDFIIEEDIKRKFLE
jgi:hypothetical protein